MQQLRRQELGGQVRERQRAGRQGRLHTPDEDRHGHACGEGDTFWDIVRSGAKQAAAKDNVEFLYSADKEGKEQAQLVQAAIDQKVDGIVVTLAKPEAVKEVVAKAVKAGIPVVTINSGAQFSAEVGALGHIGQDEKVAA